MPVSKVIRFKDGRSIKANGMIADADHDPDSNEGTYEPSGRPLPSRVDLRPHCSPIENQAQSNSCCANAIAGGYEYIMTRHAQKTGDKPVDVSRLFIYFVGRKYDLQKRKQGNLKVRDGGMSISGAIDAMHASGTCTEDVWPFDLDQVNTSPNQTCFADALNCKISASRRVPVDEKAMKEALADGHTILTGLKLTKKFFTPGPSGKIATPDPTDPKSAAHGLHAMLIVGYSDKHQVFIYRNSWGEKWGDKGYGYVPYSYAANKEFNFCGQYAIMGIHDDDMSPEEIGDDEDLIQDDAEGEESEPESDDDGEDSGDEDDDDHDAHMFSKEHTLRKVFDKWDVNASGSLRKFELLGALMNMGRRCPLRLVEDIQAKHDEDGLQGTNWEEWCSINNFTPAQ